MSTEREEFEQLSPEEKHQLALLGSMLAHPVSEGDQEIQRLMDCVRGRQEEAVAEVGQKAQRTGWSRFLNQ